MIKGLESVTLFSENAKKLAEFYRNTVGLKVKTEFEMGDNQTGFEFEIAEGSGFNIIDHSDIKGKAKDPKRCLLNFEVDDIEKEFDRLKKAIVKVIAETYHVEEYGYIATFEDPDGNYFQLVQVRA